jgi:hypothetical protein
MVEQWTPEQENEFTALYTELEKQPHYDKGEVHRRLFSQQLPYKEAKRRLEELIARPDKEQKQSGGLEKKATSSVFSGRMTQAAGLAAVLAGIAILSGFYVPPIY